MQEGRKIIIDETCPTKLIRYTWLKILQDEGYSVDCVYFKTPLETCINRRMNDNKGFPQNYPRIIKKFSQVFEAPDISEGFDGLLTIE